LIDVLVGDMSLVGPRPEVPKYVAMYPPALREKALSVQPGITDPVSLRFVDESALLARAADPEREYVEVVMPQKLAAAVAYAEHVALLGLRRSQAPDDRLRRSWIGQRGDRADAAARAGAARRARGAPRHGIDGGEYRAHGLPHGL